MKSKKRHVNIFSISTNPDIKKNELATYVMIALAMYGVRAHCFTSQITEIQGADYTMKNGILHGALRSVDIIVVFGDENDLTAIPIIESMHELNKCVLCLPGVTIAFGDKDNETDRNFLEQIRQSSALSKNEESDDQLPGLDQIKEMSRFIIKGGA